MKAAKKNLEEIKKFHQRLDDEADILSFKRYLTPLEQQRHKKVKILRLLVKEEIARFESNS